MANICNRTEAFLSDSDTAHNRANDWARDIAANINMLTARIDRIESDDYNSDQINGLKSRVEKLEDDTPSDPVTEDTVTEMVDSAIETAMEDLVSKVESLESDFEDLKSEIPDDTTLSDLSDNMEENFVEVKQRLTALEKAEPPKLDPAALIADPEFMNTLIQSPEFQNMIQAQFKKVLANLIQKLLT